VNFISIQDALHDAILCVEIDNSAVKGNFFQNIGYPSSEKSLSSSASVQQKKNFNLYQDFASARPQKKYESGTQIPAVYIPSNTSVHLIDAFGGFLGFPGGSDGGFCDGLNAIDFGKNSTTSCFRSTADILISCTQEFDFDRYVSDLFVSKEGGTAHLSRLVPNVDSSLVKVEISSIVNVKGRTSSPESTKWNEQLQTCQDALETISYTIFYNSKLMITKISASLVITNITVSHKIIQQEFSVFFISADTIKNDLEYRKKSGNPGYLFGLPTLGAKLVQMNDTLGTWSIQMQENGLSVMDIGKGGRCENALTNKLVC